MSTVTIRLKGRNRDHSDENDIVLVKPREMSSDPIPRRGEEVQIEGHTFVVDQVTHSYLGAVLKDVRVEARWFEPFGWGRQS